MPPDQNLFQEALSHHLTGDVSNAETKYREYIAYCDSLAVACTNLAAILIQKANYDEASLLLRQALSHSPDYPEALSNQGYLQLLLSDYDQAIDLLQKSLHYKPSLLQSLKHLFTIYSRTNTLDQLLPYLDNALSISFDPDVLLLQAQVFSTLSSPEKAVELFHKYTSVSSSDTLPSIYSRLAYFHLTVTRNFTHSLYYYDQSISLSAVAVESDLVNKGDCLRLLLRLPECIQWINKCLLEHPQSSALINLKAAVNRQAGDNKSALKLFNIALNIDPFNAQVLINKALCLSDLGDIPQALNTLILVRKIDPNNAFCLQALGELSFKNAQPHNALTSFVESVDINPNSFDAWHSIFYFLSFTRVASQLQRSRFVESYLKALSILPNSVYKHSLSSSENRALRIGVLSAEIGDHAVSFFLESILSNSECTDATFHIFPTRDRSQDHAWHRIRDLADEFIPIFSIDDEEAHRLILDLQLDVVIDTSHHMSFNRQLLLYRRIAPVQVHYIGVHGSTFTPSVDYFIGDSIITPPEFQDEFSETLVQLPRTWVSFTPPSTLPSISDSHCTNIRFGCFNNFMKITPETIALWSSVLDAFPDTSLLLKSSLPRETDDSRISDIVQEFVSLGINHRRVEFAPYQSSWQDHMGLYNSIDIALDTLPLTSGTTAFDSLLMGVPLVSFSSPWIGGRLSHSILHGLGRPDLVAESTAEYIQTIACLISEVSSPSYSRSKLRQEFLESDLCNSSHLSRELIATLRALHSKALLLDSGALK